jgi:hypothetical protein
MRRERKVPAHFAWGFERRSDAESERAGVAKIFYKKIICDRIPLATRKEMSGEVSGVAFKLLEKVWVQNELSYPKLVPNI